MARKAFIIASNGPSSYRLRFAENDAEKMTKCLKSLRYGFDIIWPKAKSKFQILEQLENAILGCDEDDTFICYFAGHGHLSKGKLYLVVEENEDLEKSSLRFSAISDYLQDKCKARNKLVILDCCHAGAADARDIPPKYEDVIPESSNYVVIAASDRMSTIREYADLEGSFLTQKIFEGLDAEFHIVDRDKDDRITLDDLIIWLKESNLRYNANKIEKERAPLPYLKNGHLKGTFYLTQDSFPWLPQYFNLEDEPEQVILPIRPEEDRVITVSRHPTTNKQYQKFVQETKRTAPKGRYIPFRNKTGVQAWKNGFEPWNNANFNASDQPVVCVSYNDALAYCNWVNRQFPKASDAVRAFLPTLKLWNYAAYGAETTVDNIADWNNWTAESIYHNSTKPAPVDKIGSRANPLGVSDMFGNVWEWAAGEMTIEIFCSIYSKQVDPPFLKGGGFFDDFSVPWFKPHLPSTIFSNGKNSRLNSFDFKSFDLGFRTACIIPLKSLSEEVKDRLSYCPPVSKSFWKSVLNQGYL